MLNYIKKSGLQIHIDLYNFIENEILSKLSIFQTNQDFWNGLSDIFLEFTPKNKNILKKRNTLQTQIDNWEKNNFGKKRNLQNYKKFLYEIGYLVKEPENFLINTTNIDDEISTKAGPQLVVPAMNNRYAINAANARWGSLYDALYGTDIINNDGEDLSKKSSYSKIRGKKVIKFTKEFLDEIIPLRNYSHKEVVNYTIENKHLIAILNGGNKTKLVDNKLFVAFNGTKKSPSEILFLHNGLHINMVIDKKSNIGKEDLAGIKDIILESALTCIIDLEDSTVAVDAEDKTKLYTNILGFMKGDISVKFKKNGKLLNRKLKKNLKFNNIKNNNIYKLKGKSLLLFRSVGFLMTTNAILDEQGEELPENILDDVIIALTSHFNLNNYSNQNSTKGSVYIVKPKMHGPEEVALANEIFNAIEKFTHLPKNTLKIGVMDEERRTSVNLKSCILAVKSRIAFINTGFLDRTGDEIHTSSKAGIMAKKEDMKHQLWLNSYELNNVQTGLKCGLSGKAQIGKGMWTMTDLMSKMLKEKIHQLEAGANTTWVPSPTAATIHALHYHKINVFKVQKKLLQNKQKDYLNELLNVPIIKPSSLSKEEIQNELYNNCQGILGYVVRWVEHGIGCSKVPDIQNISLMEDRATLRISSQGLANWLFHKIISKNDIEKALQKIVCIVDKQNIKDVAYITMAGKFSISKAYLAAQDLIFKGIEQPSGYTEPILYKWRKLAKSK